MERKKSVVQLLKYIRRKIIRFNYLLFKIAKISTKE